MTRLAVALLTLALLAVPLAVEAQQPTKVPRIGGLWATPLPSTAHLVEAFRHGLRELGYVEGRNIALELRSAETRSERLPGLAAELVRLGVDVIVAPGTEAALAAKNATGTIPIVMVNIGDPVGTGLARSLARPGGNITGLSRLDHEVSGKRLQLLLEVVPKVSRVAALYHPDRPNSALSFREIEVAARTLGIELRSLAVRGPNEFDTAFQAATKGRAGALIVVGDPLIFGHRARIVDLAAEYQLPALFTASEYVEAGGLMSYSPNLADMYRRAATYVDKILKGARPGDLPVEQPTKFELVVNLKTAKALGLTIPQSVLARANEVIQ